jgi:hypothetical protein
MFSIHRVTSTPQTDSASLADWEIFLARPSFLSLLTGSDAEITGFLQSVIGNKLPLKTERAVRIIKKARKPSALRALLGWMCPPICKLSQSAEEAMGRIAATLSYVCLLHDSREGRWEWFNVVADCMGLDVQWRVNEEDRNKHGYLGKPSSRIIAQIDQTRAGECMRAGIAALVGRQASMRHEAMPTIHAHWRDLATRFFDLNARFTPPRPAESGEISEVGLRFTWAADRQREELRQGLRPLWNGARFLGGFIGGPEDPVEQRRLEQQFCELATEAGILAGFPPERALEGWLDLLRHESAHFEPKALLSYIKNVVLASAEHCGILASRALREPWRPPVTAFASKPPAKRTAANEEISLPAASPAADPAATPAPAPVLADAVPPSKFQEYPFLMYDHQNRTYKAAGNYEERQRMLAQGWSEQPFPAEPSSAPAEAPGRERKLKGSDKTDKTLKKHGRPKAIPTNNGEGAELEGRRRDKRYALAGFADLLDVAPSIYQNIKRGTGASIDTLCKVDENYKKTFPKEKLPLLEKLIERHLPKKPK